MANRFNENDIQNALAQNLISREDAQYLMSALEPQGSALGAAGGALAGAALGGAGGKFAQKGFDALANRESAGMLQDIGKWGTSNMPSKVPGTEMGMPGMIADQTKGAMAAGGLLGPAGAVGGGMAGSALAGGPELSGEEANALIAALMDPNTPKKDKAMIMEYLQQMQGGMPEEQGGMPWGTMAGAGLGALAGGAAGGALGQKFMGKMAPSMGQDMPEGMGLGMGLNRGGAAGGGAGALMGGGAGALGGNAMFPASNYEDPLA